MCNQGLVEVEHELDTLVPNLGAAAQGKTLGSGHPHRSAAAGLKLPAYPALFNRTKTRKRKRAEACVRCTRPCSHRCSYPESTHEGSSTRRNQKRKRLLRSSMRTQIRSTR